MMMFTGRRGRRKIVRLANTARDAGKYREAAYLYEKALHLLPDDAAIHIQCGHMLKEAGILSRAEQHYNQAKELTPNDPDLALQFGHFYKAAGRLDAAETAYRRALELDPDWTEPAIELARMYQLGWRNRTTNTDSIAVADKSIPAFGTIDTDWVQALEGLVPEIAPQAPESKLFGHGDEITILRLGIWERTPWGMRNTVHGVDALRGFCISATPIVEVRGFINGLRIFSIKPEGFSLKYEKYDKNRRKYVFNVWYNYSKFSQGLYHLELHFLDENGGLRLHSEEVVIGYPLSEEDYPISDRLVSISWDDDQSVEDQINSRPSMIRRAKRAPFDTTPLQNILILRVDQIGDMVVSVPALRRLRELLPKARLVGLLSFANTELAKSLQLFDEVITIDFPDDEWERKRVMPLKKQHELRRQLESYNFDVAMDLASSHPSRPLLLLSGARYLVGFKDDQCPWLNATFESVTRDTMSVGSEISHSRQMLGFIEWFGALLGDCSQIVKRTDLSRDRLVPYGLAAKDQFVVMHTGARLKFKEWPHYDKLASMILDNTSLKVVMMTDDPATRLSLPAVLAANSRFQILDKRLPFDDFDAFLSFCTVFVGNDSGPGHVASLRGTNVVNLFLARQNWNEWGHENNGVHYQPSCPLCRLQYLL